MNPKQERFFQEYLVDFNGTQAAIRAGYSKKNARFTASELLDREDIQAALRAAQQVRAADAGDRADRSAKELERIAFMDMSDQAAMLNVKRNALVDLLKLDGKFIERKEVKRVDDFSGMTDEELNRRIAAEANRLGIVDLAAIFEGLPKPNGKAH